MAYLRWGHSDWYVYESEQGLEVAPSARLLGEGDDRSACYSVCQVQDLLSGRSELRVIPGWRLSSTVSKQELFWVLREYVAESIGEDMYRPFREN